jgi:hypothetical protein
MNARNNGMMGKLHIFLMLVALVIPIGCTSFIAPAPSNVKPFTVWIYQICIPKSETEDTRTATLVAYTKGVKARTTTGQPVYSGSVYPDVNGGPGGTVFSFPENLEKDSPVKYYSFPLEVRISNKWTVWLPPAQLDDKYQGRMDRFKRFIPLTPADIPDSPKIRWIEDYYRNYVDKWSKMDIPPC